ncbi:putative methyltransferase-domain-containing protein [Lyophyllum atratum]|nr:putative methyltransferase-domain-containing protein [Lyophyllum atratum]
MFFYISFLRPPPLQCAPFGNILITPQIANDLRTEPFDGTADIYYSWSQSAGFSTSSNHEVITRPVKLTTWRQATAYKEIPVPLPPGVRDGQAWCLVLGTRTTASKDDFSAIDLHRVDVGQVVLPVMSMPIQVGPRAPRKGPKQEQIERVYRLRPRTEDDAEVALRLTEQTSFDLDKKVWDSGVGLSSWLVGLEQSADTEGALAELKNAIFSEESRNILELGAGMGIVGLSLAALRSTSMQPSTGVGDRIIMTDLDSAMPLLEQNIATNAVHLQSTHLEAAVLDWDADALPEYIEDFPDGFDAIIMADVTYNTSSFPSLVNTLSKLVQLGSKPPLVVLGYKERDAAERTLWDLVEEIGIRFEKIGERVGAGGAPIEVWLGKVKSP